MGLEQHGVSNDDRIFILGWTVPLRAYVREAGATVAGAGASLVIMGVL